VESLIELWEVEGVIVPHTTLEYPSRVNSIEDVRHRMPIVDLPCSGHGGMNQRLERAIDGAWVGSSGIDHVAVVLRCCGRGDNGGEDGRYSRVLPLEDGVALSDV
jgi:hypothetical protein